VQRQSGANTISVVRTIKQLLPQLEANLPKGIQVTTLTDLTTGIKASISDVEFELLLAIALVVLVIFLFLRSVSATIIPSVAVPLSLIGTLAVMYSLGYSLDNLSLMALTIATGFVVDDAIVMIENISRYIENGEKPLAAALKGAEQIGFTILSLTVALIAVLIPLLLMGDVVGRLFREFAVTLAVTIGFSAIVSLTLTPMMSARILRHKGKEQQGRLFRASERMFERVIGFYGRTLKRVLEFQTITLLVALATLALTIFLYIIIPKGFFPVQDTGVIQGISQAPPTISARAMADRQQQLAKIILADPGVQSLSSFIGADGTNTTTNSGRMAITLKPLAHRERAPVIIGRLGPKLAEVQGIQLFLEPVQNISVDDRVSRTQYQYTLEDPDINELNQWTNRFVDRLKQLPELANVATDQQPGGLAVYLVIDRISASRLGIAPSTIDNTLYDAFGQRQINTMYTQVNQYHVILESEPQFQQDPDKLNHLYIQASASSGASGAAASASFAAIGSSAAGSNALTGSALYTPAANTLTAPVNALAASATTANANKGAASAGATSSTMSNAVPLSAFSHFEKTTEPLSITHQGQFPAITVSFDLAANAALGAAIKAVDKLQGDMHMPASLQAGFQGTAASFTNSISNEPLLILAALVAVYIVLGVLYESFIHPITILSTLPSAGVGALLALILFGQDLNVVGLIGIILLIGIVTKNGIMMVDFALDAERTQGKTSTDAIYEACLLRFRPILMTTMAALLAGLPLALGTGIGSELRKPLGIAMVGGLLLSQALTLYTTPVIYIFFDRLAQRFAPKTKAVDTGDADAPDAPAPA
jgi:multidrug efflux pump